MTISIDEAIEGLENIYSELSTPGREKDLKALGLGIEALKGIKRGRIRGVDFPWKLMPGETKE